MNYQDSFIDVGRNLANLAMAMCKCENGHTDNTCRAETATAIMLDDLEPSEEERFLIDVGQISAYLAKGLALPDLPEKHKEIYG